MGRIPKTLVGTNEKNGVINPHTQDYYGQHQGGNIKGTSHKMQGAKGTDIGKQNRC